jgi:Putative peptidoglycan binding domain
VRERRNDGRRNAVRAAGAAAAAASIGLRLWAKVARRPVDSLAILTAAAASLVIIVNAVFLQARLHPPPFVANPTAQPQAAENRRNATLPASAKTAEVPAAHPAVGPRTAQSVAGRRNDPIAELIGTSVGTPSRVVAVQRVLAEFGYGQIKPSGIVDEPTTMAIEKFESEHRLPVTGRLSDRLQTELSAMTGRPIE